MERGREGRQRQPGKHRGWSTNRRQANKEAKRERPEGLEKTRHCEQECHGNQERRREASHHVTGDQGQRTPPGCGNVDITGDFDKDNFNGVRWAGG